MIAASCVAASARAQTGPMPKPFDPVPGPSQPAKPADVPSAKPENALQEEQQESVGPQSEGAATLSISGDWPWSSSTMTGDWRGARTKLQNAGITLQGTATLDFVNALNGGRADGFSFLSLIDVNATLDTQKLVGLQGGTIFVDFQTAQQTRPTAQLVPDFWGFDVINSFGQFTALGQYWYQQEILGDRLKVKFGKIDANVDFAVPCTGLNFVNSAAYYPATIDTLMPTYPKQAGGVEILAKPLENFDVRFGFFDGTSNYANPTTGAVGPNTGTRGLDTFLWNNPGSYFMIGELGPDWKIDGHAGKFRAGWFEQYGYTDFTGVAGPGVGLGPCGTYAYANQHLFDPGNGKTLGLEMFGQFSWSEANRNPSQWSLMLGSQWQGVIESRPNDTLGFMWAYTQFSGNASVTTSPGSSETIVEGFYCCQVTPWFSVQPDLQYISQPSAVASTNVPGAWVFTMRLSFVF